MWHKNFRGCWKVLVACIITEFIWMYPFPHKNTLKDEESRIVKLQTCNIHNKTRWDVICTDPDIPVGMDNLLVASYLPGTMDLCAMVQRRLSVFLIPLDKKSQVTNKQLSLMWEVNQNSGWHWVGNFHGQIQWWWQRYHNGIKLWAYWRSLGPINLFLLMPSPKLGRNYCLNNPNYLSRTEATGEKEESR